MDWLASNWEGLMSIINMIGLFVLGSRKKAQ